MVKIWAHRGASAYAPENTIEAFKLATEMKADGVELDVHLSKDNEIIVCHDAKIDRTSNGIGNIAEMTLPELKQYNFGKLFPQYNDVKVPTLREVYSLLLPVGLYVNVEIKSGIGVIEPLLDELAKEMGMSDKVIYSSFSLAALKNIKAYNKNAKIALLYGARIDNVPNEAEFAKKEQMQALHPHFDAVVSSNLVSDCKSLGIDVNAWTVDDESIMRILYKKGINALITNKPDLARKVLAE